MAFSIPESLFTKYFEVVDYFIDNSFGVNCKIIYPSLREDCPNCYYNTLPGVGASNIYRPGGPQPFDDNICPYCNGLGYRVIENSEVIKIRAYFDTATWAKFNPRVGIKDGDAVLIGYMTDLPKLKNMAYIQLASDLQNYNWKYILSKEPIPWGFKRVRYFTTNVSRADGQG